MSAGTPRPYMRGRVEPTSLWRSSWSSWRRVGCGGACGGGGVATALPGRRRSALSESLWQRAAAEGAAAAAGTPPVR